MTDKPQTTCRTCKHWNGRSWKSAIRQLLCFWGLGLWTGKCSVKNERTWHPLTCSKWENGDV